MHKLPQDLARQTAPHPHRVHWRVSPATASPAIWRHCSRCNDRTRFICSDKFRVNAQKKILDAWLIYNCTSCDRSWNYPILERQAVKSIRQSDLTAMMQNDPLLAQSYATDRQRFRRHGIDVETVDDVRIDKSMPTVPRGQPREISITLSLGPAGIIRLDRLLAQGLSLSRKTVVRLLETGALHLLPAGAGRLRQPAQEGQLAVLYLPALADEPALQWNILKACGLTETDAGTS